MFIRYVLLTVLAVSINSALATVVNSDEVKATAIVTCDPRVMEKSEAGKKLDQKEKEIVIQCLEERSKKAGGGGGGGSCDGFGILKSKCFLLAPQQ